MATDTAQATRVRPPNGRQLWQMPAFVLGGVALAAVGLLRPTIPGPNRVNADAELAAVRQLLDQKPTDPSAALGRAQALLTRIDPNSPKAGEVELLIGTAFLLRAEAGRGLEAADDWHAARDHLEQADKLLDSTYVARPRLEYRLAKSWAHTDGDAQRIVDTLSRSLDTAGEEPAEGYRLLGQAFLRLPTPDPRKALDATAQFLARAPAGTPPALLSQARLQQAEMHTRLKEAAASRTLLERVAGDADAPPDLRQSARVQLARSLQADGDWPGAARAWENARAEAREPEQRALVVYSLGLAKAATGQFAEADRSWEEARQTGGPAAQAAALRLAHQRAGSPDRQSVIEMAEFALRGVNKPADFQNPLMPLNEARLLLEQAVQGLEAAHDYPAAQRLARLFARLAAPPRDRELYAAVTEGYAADLLARSRPGNNPEQQKAAFAQYRDAGAEYVALAAAAPAAQVDWLRKAAVAYRKAADRPRALELLDRLIALPGPNPQRGELWFEKAELHRELAEQSRDPQEMQKAVGCYQKCRDSNGPQSLPARFQLAQLYLAFDGPADQKARLADQAVAELRAVTDDPAAPQADPVLHEQALFRLAALVYDRQDYVEAEQKLDAALRRYPGSNLAANALFQLGRCWWYRAAQESQELQRPAVTDEQRKVRNDRYRDYLQRSLAQFQKVESELLRREQGGSLPPDEATLLRESSFAIADCFLFQGSYDEALHRYKALTVRYAGQVYELIALRQVWFIYQYLRKADSQPDTARKHQDGAEEALNRLATALEKIPEALFDGSTERHQRVYWEREYAEAVFKTARLPLDPNDAEKCEAVARQLQALADQYHSRVEGLTALRYLWEVQVQYLHKGDAAQQTLKRIRETMKKVPEAQFDGSTPDRQKAAWEKWLTEAAAVKVPAAPAAPAASGNTARRP
jgi:hypothetical protein